MRHQQSEKTSKTAIAGLAGLLVITAVIAAWYVKGPRFDGTGVSGAGSGSGPEVESEVGFPQEGSSPDTSQLSSTASDLRQPSLATDSQALSELTRGHEGRLIIRDVDGQELRHEQGMLVLSPLGDVPQNVKKLVTFRDGRFSLSGIQEGWIRIERATAISEEGERVVAFEEESFEFKLNEPTLLVGHYLRDCILRVVDAETGVELDEVSVLQGNQARAGQEQRHPGPHGDASFFVRNEASPVRLPRARGVQPYWITATGYGWKFVLVDHESGGERDVLLEAAGILVVEVSGGIDSYMDQDLEVYIRAYIHGTGDVAASSWLEAGGWQAFPGLAVGKYEVRVEVGPIDAGPVVLGETQVEVIANATTTAKIELARDQSSLLGDQIPPRANVFGEIVLSREYRTLNLTQSLRIQPADGRALRSRDVMHIKYGQMDGISEDDDESEILSWHAELTPGRYLFLVEPVQHGVLFDVPRAEVVNFRIVLPDLFPIGLRAIDSRTHQPINGATIRWSREVPGQTGNSTWVERESEPGTGEVIARLPAGRFSFAARAPNYGERSLEVHAGAGTSQFTLELSPCISREIVLIHGETVIPWVQEVACSFTSLGSDASHSCESLSNGRMRACFGQPGLYEITIGRLEGFSAPAPVVVDVDESDLSPIVVRIYR